MRRLNIRWTLTLWYGGVLAAVLIVFSAVVFLVMRQQLLQRIDQGLSEELADVRHEIERAKSSTSLLEWLERRFGRHEGFDFQITRPSGGRYFVSARFADKQLPGPRDWNSSGVAFENVALGAGRWRVVCEEVKGPDGILTVQVARSLAAFDNESSTLLLTFFMTGPLTLLFVVGGGYFLARRALAPVQSMTQSANQISADRLSQRIDVENPDDELGALAQTLNRMIERLERSFAEMQRFTADAAHELRTPLAVIRNEAEVALRVSRTPDEYSHVLGNLLEETNRLSHMADQLLFLCRQDAGLLAGKQDRVNIDTLLRDVIANMQLVADAKAVALSLTADCNCDVRGDASQLRRVFYNLLDNAIKYTDSGGTVAVAATAARGAVSVSIKDSGIGIPAEHLPRIFDRFYRVDPARAGEAGAGLGLSICQSIIASHDGTIVVESRLQKGTMVCVTLPNTRALSSAI
jgi:heavy metal sensor kinase